MDAERVKQLLENGDIPETTGEEICVFAYEQAKGGILLKEVVVQIEREFNEAGTYELEMLIVGYMMGQSIRESLLNLVSDTKH
jgi:hypothetical protein